MTTNPQSFNYPLTSCLTGKNLQCIRDDRILFEHLEFNLTAGAILQIEGPNGSGKTSLLRILCGLTAPTEGSVYWNEQEIESVRQIYGSQLIYIGHVSGVKVELTPLENLAVMRALSSFPSDIALDAALRQVGLRGFEDVPTRTLSAGQQRRVALARLLINQAQLWVLDEPFTALDKNAIAMVEHLIENHVKQGGLAVLTSHHQVNCSEVKKLHLNP